MTHRVPVDSAEAAELREAEQARAAEETVAAPTPATATPEPTVEPAHDPRCRDGWLGLDADERPIPCTVCRPHLADRPCPVCGQRATSCRNTRAATGHRCCSHCSDSAHPRGADLS